MYTVLTKDGRERDTTLADARKLNLAPSVTTYLGVTDKPALTRHKIKRGIEATMKMPRYENEPEDKYINRMIEESARQDRDAAIEGDRIHNAIEASFKGKLFDVKYLPHVEAARGELSRLFPNIDDWVAETSFTSPSGFGGKVDLHSPSHQVIIDWKSKDSDFTDGKKLVYDQHWQLAAYAEGLGMDNPTGANIFVSRTHPGKVASHVWDRDDMDQGWEVFAAALKLWIAIKKYNPAFRSGDVAKLAVSL